MMTKPITVLFKGYWLKHFDGKWHVYAGNAGPVDEWLARADTEQGAKNFVLIRREREKAA